MDPGLLVPYVLRRRLWTPLQEECRASGWPNTANPMAGPVGAAFIILTILAKVADDAKSATTCEPCHI